MSLSIYRIAPHYRSVEIWHANALTRQRISVSTCTPNKGQTQRQRYECIAAFLNEHGILPPIYLSKDSTK